MFYRIHLKFIFASQILSTVICYKIAITKSILGVNRLESQGQVEKVKEIVDKEWVSAQANVKINLHLQILGVSAGQQNSTYVNLLNVMQSLDYGDMVSVARVTVRASRELAKQFQATSNGDYLLYTDDTNVEQIEGKKAPLLFPIDDGNLISKAFNLIRKRVKNGCDEKFIAIVNKKIPSGTGLGGGSADAATSIKLATEILESDVDQMEIAKEVGSDVPFLLASHNGFNSCVSVGKGDVFKPIELKMLPQKVYLFIPNVFVETSRVYDRIKKLFPRGSKLSEQQLKSAEEMALQNIVKLDFRNDLMPSSCHLSKGLVKLINILESQNVFSWNMSGSGSACFGFTKQNATERQVSNELNRISLRYEEPLVIVHANLIRSV